jgi:hypothetical protein
LREEYGAIGARLYRVESDHGFLLEVCLPFLAIVAWVARSNAKLLLQISAKCSAESASQLGVDGYDEAISDDTRDQYEPRSADLRMVMAEYQPRWPPAGPWSAINMIKRKPVKGDRR